MIKIDNSALATTFSTILVKANRLYVILQEPFELQGLQFSVEHHPGRYRCMLCDHLDIGSRTWTIFNPETNTTVQVTDTVAHMLRDHSSFGCGGAQIDPDAVRRLLS